MKFVMHLVLISAIISLQAEPNKSIQDLTWQDMRIICDIHAQARFRLGQILVLEEFSWLNKQLFGFLFKGVHGKFADEYSQALKKTDAAGYGYVFDAGQRERFLKVIEACAQTYVTGSTENCLQHVLAHETLRRNAVLKFSNRQRATLLGLRIEDALDQVFTLKHDVIYSLIGLGSPRVYAHMLLTRGLPEFQLADDAEFIAEVKEPIVKELKACMQAEYSISCKKNFEKIVALFKQFNAGQ